MEKEPQKCFLENFRMFSASPKADKAPRLFQSIPKKKNQSSLTLFFIHPNILFPHPKSSHQQRLIKRMQGEPHKALFGNPSELEK